ncbi:MULTISPECIES: alpha/beta hydrolase [unclassified Variovorax]|uniref:alpha/beta hydrolase n=1 Tax=unclassified Variovorax TaxID=663243 RepID=UPI0033655FB1
MLLAGAKAIRFFLTGSRPELNATAAKGLMDVLEIDRAYLIGKAMGGHSAVAFAFADLSRVGKLVFMGGGTGGSSYVPMPLEGTELIGALYRDLSNENLRRMMNVFV